jgi:hypothetical protein
MAKIDVDRVLEQARKATAAALPGSIGEALEQTVDGKAEEPRNGHAPVSEGTGVKWDNEKPRWDLLDYGALGQVVDVLTYGARKYSPQNWRKVPDHRARYFAAAMRHLVAWQTGSRDDTETGMNHLAHAAACILFLLAREGEAQ